MKHRKMESRSPDIVRVRFAPSPTGFLHVGGARTAIFNWLFARHTGGVFLLRIEDTDVARSTKESEASLLADLEWLGLDWDEGPVKGGAFGPYRQSERIEMYEGAANDLAGRGLAYPCFCSDELLEQKKQAAVARGQSTHYDGTCRGLTPERIEEQRRSGAPESVRFKVPEGKVEFADLIRGKVTLDTSMVGDFVILRSNGLPTYNFAAAFDDHHMKITHVLRGEEHLSNTLRQTLIYRALNAEPPAFGHVPLIVAEDRSKLSKRHSASSVGDLRERGFLPGAVVNYLALLGWSHPEEKEHLTREEMIASFSVERIGKAAAAYDLRKLGWMNGLHIRSLPLEEWVTIAKNRLPEAITRRFDDGEQRDILAVLQDKVETLADLGHMTDVFGEDVSYDDEAKAVLRTESSHRVLAALQSELASAAEEWTAPAFKAAMKQVGKKTGEKGQDLFFPVRAAVTGKLHGPDLARVAAIKGKDAVERLIALAVRGVD